MQNTIIIPEVPENPKKSRAYLLNTYFMKKLLIVIFIVLSALPGFSQRKIIKADYEKAEIARFNLVKHKVFEMRALKYGYKNNTVVDTVMGEFAKYNKWGFPTEEYSSIDPELCYVRARKIRTYEEYINDEIAAGRTIQSGMAHDKEEYEIPYIQRTYIYKNDTLIQLQELTQIENELCVKNYDYSLVAGNLLFDIPNNYKTKTISLNSDGWFLDMADDFYQLGNYIDAKKGIVKLGSVKNYTKKNDDLFGMTYLDYPSNVFNTKFTNVRAFKKEEKPKNTVFKFKKGFNVLEIDSYNAENQLEYKIINDFAGETRTDYKYNTIGQLVELYRKNTALNKTNLLRYLHCFYQYNDKNLLSKRIDLTQEGDTASVIKYTYFFDGYYDVQIAEIIKEQMSDWLKKGKYESSKEYDNRTNDIEKTKKQIELKQTAINILGIERYNLVAKSVKYDADQQCFILTFDELDSKKIAVPSKEAEYFENNLDKFNLAPTFVVEDNKLCLKSLVLKNKELNKEYKSM